MLIQGVFKEKDLRVYLMVNMSKCLDVINSNEIKSFMINANF